MKTLASEHGVVRTINLSTRTRRLINVSNRLPVTVGAEVRPSSGGLVAALRGLGDNGTYDLRWIGWPGAEIEGAAERERVDRVLGAEHRCTAVHLTPGEREGFYDGFSNASLWPLLHYMPSYMRYEARWWREYQAVNRRFADAVLRDAREGDLVWVHDYHLMLLPAMLKDAAPWLRVGFFLHTPFPSYELFRCHPKRAELLAGVLGADLVGFHTFGYMRHFRSAVLRLLGVESEMTKIRYGGRSTRLGIYPIGIDAGRFEAEMAGHAYRNRLAELARDYAGRRIVLSVERMDYTKGILRRLDAIDLYLASCADRDRVTFLFVSVPSRESVGEYQSLREEVERRIGRINGTYSTLRNTPVHFIHGSVGFTDLCALYSLAEVAVVTPVIDGMNLVAKEYVAAQRDDPGVLVLSEFAGAAEELGNALVVNPYDPDQVAAAVAEALAMPAAERRRRMEGMRDRVMRSDARGWADSFVSDLARQRPARATGCSASELCTAVRSAVRSGRRVAMLLDYDGTLQEIARDPAAASPGAELRALLGRLASTPNVDVAVVSGRRTQDLERWLGDYPFALVAEHGAAMRRAGSAGWERLDRTTACSWKAEIVKVLRLYERSTPGSFVEEKRTGLVWHYRKSDPEFGTWKANMLAAELATLTASEPVVVRHGKKIVEVVSAEVNKGAAILRLLEGTQYDLLLVAGDDTTDESMFRLNLSNALTVHVGEENTAARYRLPTPAALRGMIGEAIAAESSGGPS